MGFNTTVLILNDALDELKKHPEEFVKKLTLMAQSGEVGSFSVGNHANPVQVVSVEHWIKFL